MNGYTTSEVAQMLGVAPQLVRRFARSGLFRPLRDKRGQYRFGFRDLVILRAAISLTKARVPQSHILRSLRKLRAQLPKSRSLAELRITAEGAGVVVHDGKWLWQPESGQFVIDFDVVQLAARAEPIAKQKLTMAPEDADALVDLGVLLHQQGRHRDAVQQYEHALHFDPQHATAAFNLGVALEHLGRWQEAADAYEHCIASDEHFIDAYYNLGTLLDKRGDRAGAIRNLNRYRQLGGRASS